MRLQINNIPGAAFVSWFFNPDPFEPIFMEYKIKSYIKVISRIILFPLYVIFKCIKSEVFWRFVSIMGKYIIPILAPLSIIYLGNDAAKILLTLLLLSICFLFTQIKYIRIFIVISMITSLLSYFVIS